MEITKNTKIVKKLVEVDVEEVTGYTLELNKEEMCYLVALSGNLSGSNKVRDVTDSIYYQIKNKSKNPYKFSEAFANDKTELKLKDSDFEKTITGLLNNID